MPARYALCSLCARRGEGPGGARGGREIERAEGSTRKRGACEGSYPEAFPAFEVRTAARTADTPGTEVDPLILSGGPTHGRGAGLWATCLYASTVPGYCKLARLLRCCVAWN